MAGDGHPSEDILSWSLAGEDIVCYSHCLCRYYGFGSLKSTDGDCFALTKSMVDPILALMKSMVDPILELMKSMVDPILALKMSMVDPFLVFCSGYSDSADHICSAFHVYLADSISIS